MANYPRCLLCDSKVSSVCGTIYHARGKKPPCAEPVVDSQTPTNSAMDAIATKAMEKLCKAFLDDRACEHAMIGLLVDVCNEYRSQRHQ